jgi:hypothetical protein
MMDDSERMMDDDDETTNLLPAKSTPNPTVTATQRRRVLYTRTMNRALVAA